MNQDYIEDIVRTAFLQIENEIDGVESENELILFSEAIENEIVKTHAYLKQIREGLKTESTN